MRAGAYDPWLVTEADFPRAGSREEQLRFLLRYAILAPSAHNTQPWRFKVGGNAITLFPDFARALTVSDPTHRELYLSLGCALAHLLISGEHFGFRVAVEEFPAGVGGPAARVTFAPSAPESSALDDRFAAIPRRRTARVPYAERPVPPDVVRRLQAVTAAPGVRVDVADQRGVIDRLAELTALATRQTLGRADFRSELSQWVRNNYTKRPDGMPGFVVGVPDAPSLLAPVMVRLPMLAKAEETKARALLRASPLVIVFSAAEDAPRGWMRTGVALERVWLQAIADGLAAAPYAGPFEAGDVHREVEQLLGITNMRAQSLLRVGYGPHDAHPSPRRSVAAVCDS